MDPPMLSRSHHPQIFERVVRTVIVLVVNVQALDVDPSLVEHVAMLQRVAVTVRHLMTGAPDPHVPLRMREVDVAPIVRARPTPTREAIHRLAALGTGTLAHAQAHADQSVPCFEIRYAIRVL